MMKTGRLSADAAAVHPLRAVRVVLAAALAWCLMAAAAAAAGPLDPSRLRDGAGVVSTFRGKDPAADRFLDKVLDRLPPEARPRPQDLRTVDSTTSGRDIASQRNVFLRDKDGKIRYIPKDRLKRGMREMARFMADQKDFEKLWGEAKSLIPDKHRGKVDALDKALETFEKTLGRSKKVREWGGIFGIPTSRADVLTGKGVDLLVDELDKVSDKNRKRAREELDRIRAAAGARPSPAPSTPPAPTTPSGPATGPTAGGAPPPPAPSPACTRGDKDLAAARQKITAGELGQAETLLAGIDTKACPRLAGDVDAAKQQIRTRVSDLNSRNASTMDGCDEAGLRTAAADLGKVSHPGLNPTASQLSARAAALASAGSQFEQARSSYKAGNLQASRGQLQSLLSSMSAAGVQNCPPYDRASRGIGKIDRLTALVAQANSAAAQCDAEGIDRMIAHMGKIDHVVARQALDKLNAAKTRCAEDRENADEMAEANRSCVDTYGPNSYAAETSGAGITTCECRAPYTFNFERTRCVHPEQIMAEGNRSCREEFGPHAYADYEASSYKTYVCNCGDGSRWNEDRTRCVTPEEIMAGIRERAREECRRKSKGRRLVRVTVDKSGRYTCHYRTRKTRRRPPRRRKPGYTHSPMASAALGAAIGSAIRGGKRRRGGRRRCHHQPATSATHCGGG